MEFNDLNGSFSDREMFVFAFDSNGILLANPFLPGLVGQSRLQDRDPYGKYPVKQLIWNAKQGEDLPIISLLIRHLSMQSD